MVEIDNVGMRMLHHSMRMRMPMWFMTFPSYMGVLMVLVMKMAMVVMRWPVHMV